MALAVLEGDALAMMEAVPPQCVEIYGLTEPLTEDQVLRPGNSRTAESVEDVQVNGERGIWDDQREDGKQIIELFNGTCVAIPDSNVRVIDLPTAEEGGCDAIWPLNPQEGTQFANQVIAALSRRPWAVIQMCVSDDDLQEAIERADQIADWSVPKEELETALLGHQNVTKTTTLDFEFDYDDGMGENPLAEADTTLTELGRLLSEFAPGLCGYQIWGRTECRVRRPADGDDIEELRTPGELDSTDTISHLNFLERRKFCGIYAMSNEGGELSFFADDGTERTLPLAPRKLIIFNHDKLSYKYKPAGDNHLAIQVWYFTQPWVVDSDVETGVVEVPEWLEETRVNIMAARCHYPGSCNDVMNEFAAGLCASFDGFVKVPTARWDHNLYYDQIEKGKSYCEHGAFMDDKQLTLFDNMTFGISENEANYMSPSQRTVLNTGLECLIDTGYQKEALKGQKIGTFLGDSSSDWTFSISPDMPASEFSVYGRSNAITTMRLNYVLGMKGPASCSDTACSSSLVAVGNAHTCIRKPDSSVLNPPTAAANLDEAVALGVNLIIDPHLFIGYCGASMLAKMGRCFTFDRSAMGFARGEGCGAFHLLSSAVNKGHPDNMLAVLVGSFINQDGRSATMTAPNGPSQRDATIASLEESGFTADAVNTCECHGTGTALGDPIEVSALRNAIGHLHESPLYFSSAKTNCGHQEANAGLAGLHKCVTMLSMCGSMPNNHLVSLNPHLDVYMFPAYFETELTDFEVNTGLCGVSSFGSGGTNARADVWAPARRGPHRVNKIHDSAEVYRKRNVFFQRVEDLGMPGPHQSDEVYLVGTWNAWTGKTPMKRAGDDNTFEGTIVVGETLQEEFRIVLDEDMEECIHPMVPKAKMDAPIVGPDLDFLGLNWHIDATGQKPGTTYRIVLEWNFDWDRGEKHMIKWEVMDEEIKSLEDLSYRHTYSIVGGWTTWKPIEMAKVDAHTYTTAFRIGAVGQEEFYIQRDNDPLQVIHPATRKAFKQSIPIRGPDDLGHDKHWLQTGTPGERADVTLKILDGEITLTVKTESKGLKKWSNQEHEGWHDYYVSGSWTNWGINLMPAARSKGPNFYKARVTIGEDGREIFKIVLDRDWEQQIYPDIPNCGLTESATMLGPDNMGHYNNWCISGEEGQEFEVILDMNTRSVSWSLVA